MKKHSKVLIMIPAYNEAENIFEVVENLIRNYPQYDYVVINDGSTDATESILAKNGFNYLSLPINLGIGGAVQTGYKYAYEMGYEAAAQIDGDGQHDVAYLSQMLEKLNITGSDNDKFDIVIGSRFINKEGFQSSLFRRLGIRFLGFILLICTGKKFTDATSGFRLCNSKFIRIYSKDYPIDYPEPKAIVVAAMNKGKIVECPVVMKERINGESSINWINSIYYMIKVTLDILICRLSFGVRRK